MHDFCVVDFFCANIISHDGISAISTYTLCIIHNHILSYFCHISCDLVANKKSFGHGTDMHISPFIVHDLFSIILRNRHITCRYFGNIYIDICCAIHKNISLYFLKAIQQEFCTAYVLLSIIWIWRLSIHHMLVSVISWALEQSCIHTPRWRRGNLEGTGK